MAQHLAIAKAALSASLFRADPTSLTRPAVEALFPLLSSTITECSRPNVQKCKAWIVDNVAPSRVRTAALGKYLVALSKSLDGSEKSKPSMRRRRLHILYILSDVAHHVVVRLRDDSFGDAWEAHLPVLVACAADFENCPKHMKKLDGLLDLWEEKSYFDSKLIARLRTALSKGVAADTTTTQPQHQAASVKLAKDAPYVLPSSHGDPSTPWYDLPAATWLPHMTPNSTKPMLPDMIQPTQLAPGPADKQLVAAVQGLLADVERLFSKDRKMGDEPQTDLNELGERIVIDEVTGEIVGGETYYGWSRTFCEKMKERKRKARRGLDRGRSRSRSRSDGYSPRSRSRRSSSAPAFRRRASSSGSRSSRRRSRSRSYSREARRDGRDRSRSLNDRRDRSYRRRSDSRSPSRSPPRHQPPSSFPQQGFPNIPPNTHQAFPPFPMSGDLPPPPPPPAGYQGPWPPPPPPPPMGNSGHPPPPPPQGWFPGVMPPNMMGRGAWDGQPPPPPPPPPPQSQSQYHHQGQNYGRGNGGYRGRGRGGYDRGRGW